MGGDQGDGHEYAYSHRFTARCPPLAPRRLISSTAKKGFRAIVGAPPIIEWVAPGHLSVDPSYQRSIDNAGSRRLIASIAASFDWRLFSSLIVSARPDGSRFIIDGQHRWAAAMRRGDLTHLPCCSFSYRTPEDEARMFHGCRSGAKSPDFRRAPWCCAQGDPRHHRQRPCDCVRAGSPTRD